MEINVDINITFKVGSWLLGVDSNNREQLLKACQDWRPEHTELLLADLDARLSGGRVLDVPLVRTGPKKLMYAAVMLSRYSGVPTAPTSIGLKLIS